MTRFSILCALALLFAPVTILIPDSDAAVARELNAHQPEISNKMATLRVMVAKLRELVLNLKDIDDLENVGLSHADAQLMRLALQEKINQTQDETLALIRRL